jgi:hypothetical protein
MIANHKISHIQAIETIPTWFLNLPPNTWTCPEIITNAIAGDQNNTTAQQVHLSTMEALYELSLCKGLTEQLRKFARRCLDYNQGHQLEFLEVFERKAKNFISVEEMATSSVFCNLTIETTNVVSLLYGMIYHEITSLRR